MNERAVGNGMESGREARTLVGFSVGSCNAENAQLLLSALTWGKVCKRISAVWDKHLRVFSAVLSYSTIRE